MQNECLKEEVVWGDENEVGYGWASVHVGLSR